MRFPVKAACATEALYCDAGLGTVLQWWSVFGVGQWVTVPTDCFVWGSRCEIGKSYDDVLRKGRASLTGAENFKFTPAEVEVFSLLKAER